MSDDIKTRDDRHLTYKFPLDELCMKAIKSWGFDPQMDMVIEEMSELTKAILKYRRNPTDINAKYIAEELADVRIMLRQLDIAMIDKHSEIFDHWEKTETNLKLLRLDGMLERSNQ